MQVCEQTHIQHTALMFQTHSVFIIVLVFEYLLLLKLYRVKWGRELKPWLLARYWLIDRQTTEQQFLPLSHQLLWNQTGHDSRKNVRRQS